MWWSNASSSATVKLRRGRVASAFPENSRFSWKTSLGSCFLFDSVPRALTRRVRSVEDDALPLHGSSAAIAATILMAAEVINPLWDAPVKSTDAGGVGRNQSPW